MSDKNVVSIEDRIPKLKHARKKKANRRLIFYLSIFFLLIAIVVYLQSPLSHIRTIEVNGNTFLNEEKIIKYSELTTDTNIWTINTKSIEQAIAKDPVIKNIQVNRNFPSTVTMEVEEQPVIGYINVDSDYVPVLGNGEVLSGNNQGFTGNAPFLHGFNEEQLKQLATEMKDVPQSIMSLISEIHWVETDEDINKIMLYMNDGYTVLGSLREISNKISVYPSIVSQLEPEDEGVIHIGVGVYFESYHDDEDVTELEVDETSENDSEDGAEED
ncbi:MULTISPECIES: FtsQ-type POTRA domain-containing protein [Oceanobacillus]|uniref:Cell division protein DivIB n=1 Tax=Oceanobacillus kimchii TaxID=746691 RepID=A0ABQ5TJU6_9BACI|nr:MULTISPECIES: FtsQ-type POTRA domain-containing protein [Oceanobacillus]MBT2598796.1 FtsQ-type POTRA domain-containing protein [Oceanobacillus sp. ISL-74]MBT2651715.1 FtsQ-type POTRA domain-containing protein [Oceanobacillus sp. ISL-73]MCT1576364.1 FtsQ-type POTRA domain-containing protein [Oceanobacillus kimchii]MCT2136000.1 FtsQ-type POTRA domain-containing protein [Oceanobacillus kimchii]OEH54578.1 cell division protein FtsQ [Oceanobacillus sp. E9]